MTMQQVASIPVPAGETVTLEPGGLHMMLIDLASPLTAGDTFELTLEFASGAKVTTTVEVRAAS
jgi:copper(I)-binding protein